MSNDVSTWLKEEKSSFDAFQILAWVDYRFSYLHDYSLTSFGAEAWDEPAVKKAAWIYGSECRAGQ